MKPEILRVASAAIVAFGLIVGGFLMGGRYVLIHTETSDVAKLDRYTGAISMCVRALDADTYTCSQPVP